MILAPSEASEQLSKEEGVVLMPSWKCQLGGTLGTRHPVNSALENPQDVCTREVPLQLFGGLKLSLYLFLKV